MAYMIFRFQYGLPVSEIFQANWILGIWKGVCLWKEFQKI
jgi:hypothetical protein